MRVPEGLSFVSLETGIILERQGTVSEGFYPPRGWAWARFIAWRLRRTFLGECRRGPRHLWECRACLRYVPRPGPTKKGFVSHSPIWWAHDKYLMWTRCLFFINTVTSCGNRASQQLFSEFNLWFGQNCFSSEKNQPCSVREDAWVCFKTLPRGFSLVLHDLW